VPQQIRDFVLSRGLTPAGELAKSVGLDMVDANLISVAVPHGLLSPGNPVMRRTVARIERDLHAPGSGVHRHLEDVYYGGGTWVLLALWLAWYYLKAATCSAPAIDRLERGARTRTAICRSRSTA
jgi:GH15 family glucan-1,4-alpha-glucosidase